LSSTQFVYAFFYGIFVFGTVIPPLLPTVFVVSVGISAQRLRQKQITCTYSEGILIAGKVNCAFFDKTGTLTQSGMSYFGTWSEDGMGDQVKIGMAVCHSLRISKNGEMLGNHVDQASFSSTGAELTKGENMVIKLRGKSYTILKQNEFDNHRVTQSVVVQDETGTKLAFVKGSPESIRALCDGKTIPKTFDGTLRSGAKLGIYQLALASKKLDPSTDVSVLTRDDLESSLGFCGFIHFQNKIKSDTGKVIKELQGGDVSVSMITGDNVLTGICIAREAGMIEARSPVLLGRKKGEEVEWVNVDNDQVTNEPYAGIDVDLALTGEAWNTLLINDPKYAKGIFTHVRVFGRCNPSDKVSVVTTGVELGFKTLMCGDGQNDCGALKSAHVGIALSSSEASVVAPFTSLEKSITSVVDVLREGRCALSSAFKVYSFYIIYGQLESYLQTIAAYMFISFTEWCWVFMDGFWSLLMAFSLPLASAAPLLSPYRPTASLLGPRTMFSVCGLLAWNFFFLTMALVALNNQDWYQCRKWTSEDVSNVLVVGDNYETSVLFIVGGFQYMASAVALNFGYTFRASWFKNYVFVSLVSLFMIFQFVATLVPSSFSCIWRLNCDNEVRLTFGEDCRLDTIFSFLLLCRRRMLSDWSLQKLPWL
jgi:cation-transporting ATPase 13A3/4/5